MALGAIGGAIGFKLTVVYILVAICTRHMQSGELRNGFSVCAGFKVAVAARLF